MLVDEVAKDICLAKAGDKEAFDRLYEHYQKCLINFLVRQYRLQAREAESLYWEAMDKIWSKLDVFVADCEWVDDE